MPADVAMVDADARAADRDVATRPVLAVAPGSRHRAAIMDRPPKFLIYAGVNDMAPAVGHVGLAVYTFISENANRQGECWLHLADLVAGCHIVKDTVVGAQKRLKAAGMIDYRRGTFGRPNKYTILQPARWARERRPAARASKPALGAAP